MVLGPARTIPEQIEAILDAQDVPASRVFAMEDIFANEHYRFRNMLMDVPDEDFGSVRLSGMCMPRMLEPKRLKDFHFTVEDGAGGSWPVFSGGMSAALA